MIQRRGRPRLAEEALGRLGIVGAILRQENPGSCVPFMEGKRHPLFNYFMTVMTRQRDAAPLDAQRAGR